MPLIINGRPIDDNVLDAEFGQLKAHAERTTNVSCCERDPEFRQAARENVVGRVLLADEAVRTVEPSPAEEVEQTLERLKQEHGGEAHFYAAMGIAPEQLDLVRNDIDVNLRVNKLLDRLIADDPAPTDDQLRAFYQENIAAYTTPEERRASHISKGVSRMAAREGLLDEFRSLREQILDGADFNELAKAHSDRGEDLVDLGFFRRGDLPEEVEMVAFSMRPGEVSPVFSSSVGVHIMKLHEVRAPAAKPFDEAREQVVAMYLDQRKRDRAAELVKRLQATATIEEVAPDPDEVNQLAT
ncbi:MAG TPA: peptidylprolyl isomerase [Tepidisphaeraceae bacterium]|nr:peptidylprolyl isomerase [Tepidisphaeraceae bacterium]